MTDEVILEVALNGGTPRSRSPAVPITVDEVVADALRCIEAGAAGLVGPANHVGRREIYRDRDGNPM